MAELPSWAVLCLALAWAVICGATGGVVSHFTSGSRSGRKEQLERIRVLELKMFGRTFDD